VTKTTTALLAAAAGALFLAQPAPASEHEKSDGKVKCEGANGCKGSSACHTASHDCAGKNECKGKGYLMLTPEECKAAKDKLGKED
jgi:hypothetical protein